MRGTAGSHGQSTIRDLDLTGVRNDRNALWHLSPRVCLSRSYKDNSEWSEIICNGTGVRFSPDINND
jgi:hypothetical protein